MARRMRRAFSLGMRLASIGRKEIEKEMKRAYGMKRMNGKRARKVLSALLREASISGRHFEAFAKQEAGRIAKKVKPLMKEAAKKAYRKARKAGKKISRRRKR